MRVLICGDRNWTCWPCVAEYVASLPPDTVVIEGEASGADTMARIAAEQHRLHVEKYPADWKRFGKSAGPLRNAKMLVDGQPDLVIAFHNSIAQSKGTLNMVTQAARAKVSYEVKRCPHERRERP